MVRITYSPAEELVVHEAVSMDKDDLLRERVTPAGTMPLYWCNGILFSFSSLPMTDDIVKDYLRGKIHWLEVHFAKEDKYNPILTLNDEQYKATMNIRVIDTSNSALHKEFAKWLKTTLKK
ncbi:MAG: hypothetical protein M1122_03240 [Candidatus Marsarchaeota archaeon]|jgi:hypothetical protein|nr:hypothetical protein [Candidatus Marsarchaeota archaeon]